MSSLSDTLHKMIDLLPWREEGEQLDAHKSVTRFFDGDYIPPSDRSQDTDAPDLDTTDGTPPAPRAPTEDVNDD